MFGCLNCSQRICQLKKSSQIKLQMQNVWVKPSLHVVPNMFCCIPIAAIRQLFIILWNLSPNSGDSKNCKNKINRDKLTVQLYNTCCPATCFGCSLGFGGFCVMSKAVTAVTLFGSIRLERLGELPIVQN